MPPVKAFCIIFILISELSHKASVLGIGPWCPWNVLPRFTKKHVNCQRLWTSWHYRGILNLKSQNYLKYNLVFCYIYPKAKWKCGYIVFRLLCIWDWVRGGSFGLQPSPEPLTTLRLCWREDATGLGHTNTQMILNWHHRIQLGLKISKIYSLVFRRIW